MNPSSHPAPSPLRAVFRKDAGAILLAIVLAALGGALWSHKDYGFNPYNDDYNWIRFWKTGKDDCSTFDKPYGPYAQVARQVILQPPEVFLPMFNASFRSLPSFLQFSTWRMFGNEDIPSGRGAMPLFLLNYALFAAMIVACYAFAALLFGKAAGLFAALFFSAHPVQSGFLGWACTTPDPLAFLLMMGSALCHLLVARHGIRPRLLRAISLACFALLTMTKESFLSLWVVLALIHLCHDAKAGRRLAVREALPRYIRLFAPYLAVIVLFVILHRLYYGPGHGHARWDFGPAALLDKLAIYPYKAMTLWSLNVKGFLFEGGRGAVVDALTAGFWVSVSLGVAWLILTRRISRGDALFCWLFFHASALHFPLMAPVDVEYQRWLVFPSVGAAMLLGLAAEKAVRMSRRKAATAFALGAAYAFLLIGMVNNHGAYLREGWLESVGIPKAVLRQYPEFPDRYEKVFLFKEARAYLGDRYKDRVRTIKAAGFYHRYALQYWYRFDRERCLLWTPGFAWKEPVKDALYIVYDYDADAVRFHALDDAGNMAVLASAAVGRDR
jgi:hypothetical protein